MALERTRTYAMLLKPVGAACNLRCAYCYYLDKGKLLGQRLPQMPDEVLEQATRQLFAMHGTDATVEFAWHGGEPLLAGLPFFRKAMTLQRQYGCGRHIRNTLQTNGTLLDAEWCRFFRDNGFLLGVSIDGPEEIHNAYRRDAGQTGSFAKTMRGVELLQRHSVPFNTLTTVNAVNCRSGTEVYRFLRELTDFLQFLPVVETTSAEFEMEAGQRFAAPSGIRALPIRHPMTGFSVSAEGFGAFMCAVHDAWHGRDAGVKHVQLFDSIMDAMRGKPSALCTMNPVCGHSGCIEADGSVYACDRYAFPDYRLGNLLETPLQTLMEQNRAFGMHKTYGLPQTCFDCAYLKLCFGGCPKDRLLQGRNALCAGYQRLFARFGKRM